MAKEKFFKGPKLLSLAKHKAGQAGLDSEGLKLEDLICRIQEKEGYTVVSERKKHARRWTAAGRHPADAG